MYPILDEVGVRIVENGDTIHQYPIQQINVAWPPSVELGLPEVDFPLPSLFCWTRAEIRGNMGVG